MAFLSDSVLDNGLNVITEATSPELHICSSEPTDRATALSLSLGQKVGLTLSTPANGTPDGREVTVSAISDGAVDTNGTASHWALIDGTELIAANTLTSSQVVTSGNSFSLTAITIRIPDAV